MLHRLSWDLYTGKSVFCEA